MKNNYLVLSLFLFTLSAIVNAQQSAYAIQTIPGKVFMKNYDLGGAGIAYHDDATDYYWSLHRGVDSVDLLVHDNFDTVLVGINIGEWSEYTMSNVVSGNYDIFIRYAGIHDGGINVKLIRSAGDTATLASTVVSPTNAWDKYIDTILVKGVSVTSGTANILRVEFPSTSNPSGKGIMNLNWIEFKDVATNYKATTLINSNPMFYSKSKNIQWSRLNATSSVDVYNLLGQIVFKGKANDGIVNLSALNAGCYIVVLQSGSLVNTLKILIE